MEEALRAQLLGHAGLVALVGDRISWSTRPQGDALPAIALHRISGRRDYTMAGRSGLVESLIQIDCWGGTYASSLAVSRAVVAALDTLTDPLRAAFIDGERQTFEAADGPAADGSEDFYRTSLDARLWHAEL